jgi:hypothetical protein
VYSQTLEVVLSRPTVTSERIDDVPLLIHWLLQMHIDTIIDAVLGPPHGNRRGLSSGQLAVVFIAYVLIECNHVLSPVREWVLARRTCVSSALGVPLGGTPTLLMIGWRTCWMPWGVMGCAPTSRNSLASI